MGTRPWYWFKWDTDPYRELLINIIINQHILISFVLTDWRRLRHVLHRSHTVPAVHQFCGDSHVQLQPIFCQFPYIMPCYIGLWSDLSIRTDLVWYSSYPSMRFFFIFFLFWIGSSRHKVNGILFTRHRLSIDGWETFSWSAWARLELTFRQKHGLVWLDHTCNYCDISVLNIRHF